MTRTPLPFDIGPGSQPADDDGAELAYMEMPAGMMTYAMPALPEPEEVAGVEPALAVLARIHQVLWDYAEDGPANIVDIHGLDATNLAFLNQALGEGEVAVIGGASVQAQESVLAGVWRVRTTSTAGAVVSDIVEVGSFPTSVSERVFADAQSDVALPAQPGPGVFNAPSLLPEINAEIERRAIASEPHVINLSLLPHTEQDLALLDRQLGKGWLTVLSRGYGNCRVESTGTRNVWWVRYYNSQDALILNTIEITAIPEIVRAAREDIRDSAGRLYEILEVYR